LLNLNYPYATFLDIEAHVNQQSNMKAPNREAVMVTITLPSQNRKLDSVNLVSITPSWIKKLVILDIAQIATNHKQSRLILGLILSNSLMIEKQIWILIIQNKPSIGEIFVHKRDLQKGKIG